MISINNDNTASSLVSGEVVIRLSGISKKYNLYKKKQDRLKEALHPRRKKYHREFYALKNINLEVKRGEVLGIVGKNGSGKSTLLKVISNILTPTAGMVEIKGKVVALLELGAGFNPEFTGMENIYFYCSLLGYKRQQTDEIIRGIIDFAELEDFIHQPIKTYSSGMRARLAFAVSINVDPEILILDEVLAVGDELFKRKCYARMEEFFKGGKTMLFVSHSAQSINQLCTRAMLLDRGECILEGQPKLVTMYYQKYLFAEKENMSSVRNEIIEINKDFELKNQISNQFKNADEVKIVRDDNLHVRYDDMRKQDAAAKSITDKSLRKHTAYYIDNLKPKSTLIYKTYDVDISNVEIRTLDDIKVNVLDFNKWYYLCYMVKFNLNTNNVSFAMNILNQKGINISATGGLRNRMNEKIDAVKDDLFLVKYKFKNIMAPGIHYANIQVSGDISGEHKVLSRIHDAVSFKTNDSKNARFLGFVSLEQSLTFQKILPPTK